MIASPTTELSPAIPPIGSTLWQIQDCVTRKDKKSALDVLRSTISECVISPRDGIELMLAVRQEAWTAAAEALEALRTGLPGVYRFAPQVEYALS
ncbi:MAG: hypothetical protein PHQ04_09410 [Opitutaceae bacterium]|nr:hypothetical protein [Opitutaceae bacterium]